MISRTEGIGKRGSVLSQVDWTLSLTYGNCDSTIYTAHQQGGAMRGLARVLSVCVIFTLLLGFPLPTFSQDPIKIGFAYVFSERLSHYGFGAKQGAELAMEEINRAGGVLGRQMKGIYADTHLRPDVGIKVVTKLINEEKVDAVMGLVSSEVASAVAPLALQYRTPLIITLAMTPDVTGKICNAYTFRVSQNGPQNIKGAAIVASESKTRLWTTIGPDYLFGYQCWEYFQKYLGEKRSDIAFAPDSGTAFAPVSTDDFTPYIDKVMKSGADGVLVSLYGGNLVDFVRQAGKKGFFDGKRFVIMNLAYSADVMFGLGLDMPKGIWLGGLYWFQANESRENKHFVDSYVSKYKIFPDYNAYGGYAGVKLFAEAIRRAGSTDKQKIVEVMEGIEMDLPPGRVLIRAQDHQAIFDGSWGLTGEFDGKLRCRLLKPLKILSGNDIAQPVSETGCKR